MSIAPFETLKLLAGGLVKYEGFDTSNGLIRFRRFVPRGDSPTGHKLKIAIEEARHSAFDWSPSERVFTAERLPDGREIVREYRRSEAD